MKTITHFSAIKKAAFVMFLVLMGYTSFAQTTYCSDSVLLGGGTTEYIQIDSVVIKGTSLHNYTPGNINTYRSFPAADSTTATLQQGATYTLVVNTGIFEVSKVGVWIDYNHNGTFDPAEYISVPVTPVAGNQVVTFTVPFAALTGETGMRIRNAGGGIDSSSACSYLFSGETEEYIITIDTTYPCTGTPIVGAISGKDSACVVDTFTLFTTGGTLAAGLTYQWLSRPSGTGSFTAIAGATSSTYTAYGLPATTDLEVRVTCTGSGLSSTSASYTIYELPFYRCYCDSASIGGSTSYVTLDHVGIVGTTLNNYTPGNIFPYLSFPDTGSTTGSLVQGGTYTVVVNSGGYPYSGAAVGIWIDYNHDGLFEGSEYSLVGIGSSGDQSASFTVPITALTGKTGLRVRNTNSYLDSSYACTYMGIGTTEDYVITIDTSDPCTGTPMAGTLSALHAVCPATAFMVSAAGYSVASGLAFQWLSRPAGAGAFTAVPGSTSASLAVSSQLAPTDYEFQVTCVSSGMSATSAAITINELPFYKCYCDSVAVGGSAYYTIIDSVAIGGITLHNYTPSILSSYAAFPAADSTTATMKQGSAYHLYVNAQGGFYTGYPNYIGMWIDYDHSGTFDPGEYTTVGTNVSATATTFFTIPLSARTGPTAMRIRNISTEFSDTMGAADACTQYSSGNTEDYIITIDSSTLYVPQTINAEFMVKAFPNPVNNIVTIQTSGTPGTNCTISLTDITGRIIEKTNVTVIKTQLDMSGLAAGIYVIKYEDDEHSRVIKIIRQ